MYLQCCECSTRFVIQDSKIGLGRTVRCGVCRYEWFQEGNHNTSAYDQDNFLPAPDRLEPLPEGSNVPAIIKGHSIFWQAILKALRPVSVILITIGILAFLLMAQNYVVNFIPFAQNIYNYIGFSDNKDLVLDAVSFERKNGEYSNNFIIKGYITNNSNAEKLVPDMAIKIYSKEGNLLEKRLISGTKTVIKPKKDVYFAQNLEDVGSNANKIQIDIGNKIELLLR